MALLKDTRDLAEVKLHMKSMAAHSFGDTPTGRVLDDSLNIEGKMLRARLVLTCGRLSASCPGPASLERLYTLAAMVEMLHLASLIHDDIVDEARFRRGKPSIQSKYGKDAAVYAGDFLIARVYYHTATQDLVRASVILSETIALMCGGEIGQAACRFRPDVTGDDYLQVITGKTAELFAAACRVGAMEAGLDESLVERLGDFGRLLGIMFQLRDDLLDFTGEAFDDGKDAYTDFMSGIYTYPVLAVLKGEGPEVSELRGLMEANSRGHLSEEELERAHALVRDLAGVEKAKAELLEYKIKAEDILKMLPEGDERRFLQKLLDKLTE